MTATCISCDARTTLVKLFLKQENSFNFNINQDDTQFNPRCDMCRRSNKKEITIECLEAPIKFYRIEKDDLNFYGNKPKSLPKKIGRR